MTEAAALVGAALPDVSQVLRAMLIEHDRGLGRLKKRRRSRKRSCRASAPSSLTPATPLRRTVGAAGTRQLQLSHEQIDASFVRAGIR